MRINWTRYFLILTATLVGQLIAGCASKQALAPTVESKSFDGDFSFLSSSTPRVVILFMSDLHGRLQPDGAGRGGYARIAQLVSAHRKNAGPKTDIWVIVGGDVAGKGAVPCVVTHDKACFPLLGKMGINLGVLGNGELKRSLNDVENLITLSGITWINSNVVSANSRKQQIWKSFLPWTGEKSGLSINFASWTLPPTPGEVDPKKTGYLARMPVVENEIGLLSAQIPAGSNIVWLPHQTWTADQETVKSLCAQNKFKNLALLKSNDHVHKRIDDSGCFGIFEPGPFGQVVSRLVFEKDSSTGEGLQLKKHDFIDIDEKISPDIEIENEIALLYKNHAPQAQTLVGQSQEILPVQKLGDRVAVALREITRSDVGVYNRGGVKEDLPQGPVTQERLSFSLPYNDDVVGLDWKFSDFERALCQASRRSIDNFLDFGSELFIAGARIEGFGTPNCKVILDKPRSQVKVAMPEYLSKRSERWLGTELRGRVFKFGVDIHRALSLSVQRKGGVF